MGRRAGLRISANGAALGDDGALGFAGLVIVDMVAELFGPGKEVGVEGGVVGIDGELVAGVEFAHGLTQFDDGHGTAKSAAVQISLIHFSTQWGLSAGLTER